MADTLEFPESLREPFESYLPQAKKDSKYPFVTLTYAASLDSRIAAAPGQQTVLSGPVSKAMTHFLRTRHDAILVGSGTVLADDPRLNSRLAGATRDNQPRPVILDRRGRWDVPEDSRLFQTAKARKGKGPWVFYDPSALAEECEAQGKNAVTVAHERALRLIRSGGDPHPWRGPWPNVMEELKRMGIKSVMVEGGASCINSLLTESPELIDALIVTVAPAYLGAGGVAVAPEAARLLRDATWVPLERDAVLCARIPRQ